MKGITMRKSILTSVLAIGLLLPVMAPAQGTLYASNLGQTPLGSVSIGSDSWIAQRFYTGTNSDGYFIDSVQLLMDAASGSPSGFNVSIYSSSTGSLSGQPYNNLGNLVGPTPSLGGLFTYTTSGIMVSPLTYYFVVATAATPMAQGAYNWSATGTSQEVLGWNIGNFYFSSADGLSWQASRQYIPQLGIYATAVPEPATLALAVMGLAVLSLQRHKS